MNSMLRFALLASSLAISSSPVLATDLVTEPEGAMYLQPPTINGQVQTLIGDQSVLNPSWSIIQQGAPVTIPAGSGQNYTFPPNTNWQLSQGSSFRIQFYATPPSFNPSIQHVYELAQNSNGAKCTGDPSSGYAGDEWILLAASIPQGPPYGAGLTYPNGNQVPSRTSQSAPLNQLSHVTIQVGLTIPYEVIGTDCFVNANGYQVGLGIRNRSQNKLIYYYITFRDSRGQSAVAQDYGCYGNKPGDSQYCFDTSAQFVGGSGYQSVSNTRVAYNLDVYADLKNIITNIIGDPNLGNWTIDGGATFGQGGVGHFNNVADWDSFKLSAY